MNGGSYLAVATALGMTLSAADAPAQDRREEAVVGQHRRYESPQHFAAELRFSPYTPDIDSDPTVHGKTPYQQVFGTAPRLFVGVEVDWQAVRIPHLGTLGPGLSAGWTSISDPAPFLNSNSGTSAETTSIDIYPFDAMAVLRADVLWRDVGIPLVPYAKLGVGYALWRASNTLGTSTYNGIVGKGHSAGTHVALGVSLNLNVFDTYAAQNFDDSMGVNGTYIFAEWTREDLSGFGSASSTLRVGGTNWTFGLAFEF